MPTPLCTALTGGTAVIAKIAISAAVYAIDKPYDYAVPESVTLLPGMRVRVPFGRGDRMCEGMVLSVAEGGGEGLKTVSDVMDDAPVLGERMLRLAAFLRERYFCTFYDAIKVILPAGLWFSNREQYTVAELPEDWEAKLRRKPAAIGLLRHLQELGGSADRNALSRLLPDAAALDDALRYLLGKKLITGENVLLQKKADKTERLVELCAGPEDALAYAAEKRRTAPLQASALELLAAVGAVSVKELCYFTGASLSTLNRLEGLGFVRFSRQEILRQKQIEPYTGSTEFPLTPAQQQVYDGLQNELFRAAPGVSLLYGVTGSGKTAVYLHLIRRCLALGRSAILLVPEIALTPQLLSLLSACFGDKIAVLHSSLRVGERYDEWKRVRRGEAQVVVGTRSAVFAPVTSLGLLIVDEEQEHTYKSENSPRYHAREVAIYRGAKERALVLLGSATPSVESMYRAKQGIYTLYTLRERFNGKDLPHTQLVDMKRELRQGNASPISTPLIEAIRAGWQRGEKTILLLNRRGAGRLTVCVDCGRVAECPHCSVNLTYHMANRRLMCHYCGYSEPCGERCPDCGGHIKQLGFGTQRVQQALQSLLPNEEILRMDADTVTAGNPHEKILSRFEKEAIPVLVGTQMVAKGLNFDDVTLVGAVDADMSLYVDNFRASETTFALLTQVVGRAGRGSRAGSAIIQTMTPQNTVLKLAAAQDYDAFYEAEIALRKARRCPPFFDLLQIGFFGLSERRVVAAAEQFRDALRGCLAAEAYRTVRLQILGPAPASVTKLNNRYRYRLTLNCENTRTLRELLAWLLKEFARDRQNRDVAVYADVNPYE